MALNKTVFKTRAITAVVFAAVMLVGLLWNKWSFFALFSVIHFGCWWEYLKLIEKIRKESIHIYQKIGWMLFGYGLMLGFCNYPYQIGTYIIKDNFSLPFSIAGFVLIVTGIFYQQKITLKTFGAAALGMVYISLSWGLMLQLYFIQYPIGTNDSFSLASVIPIVLIASIWINDTMAYIVGSLIGKTPLSSISPKKTWEGTLGGIALAVVVVAVLFSFIYQKQITLSSFTILGAIALIAAITGTLGDLLESKLKRMAGVKDSGNFMPGHGGFLDRFDSLLIATPFVWLTLYLIYTL